MIQLQGLSKTYPRPDGGEVRALDHVSIDIERGDFVAIVGASGSGKSTLLNILGLLDVPTDGRYVLNGTDAARLSAREMARLRNRKIGFVFQAFHLLPRTSALENVELPLLYSDGDLPEGAGEAALARVGLADRVSHTPAELSGGQQQRVAIARALVNNPDLILADEPTGNLDTRTSIEVMGIFQRLNREQGITVLLITHEMDIAEYGTRLIRFRDGRIVADQKVLHRRNAADELAALPPPEPDQIPPVADEAQPAAH
jgi:putative ABC transport system ATP-binding protein